MASSYGSSSQVNSGLLLKKSSSDLNLPVFYHCTKTEHGQPEQRFELDLWNEEDFDQLYKMFEQIVYEGQSYPQSSINETEFRNYFLGGDAFVVRTVANVGDQSTDKNKVAGAFYIKPNFPGRSSHLANYGLMVNPDYRGKGIATFMVEQCIRLAPLVGPFRALYTNLVFVTNVASIRACERFGFTQVGRVPNAGNLKGIGYTDALQFYREV